MLKLQRSVAQDTKFSKIKSGHVKYEQAMTSRAF